MRISLPGKVEMCQRSQLWGMAPARRQPPLEAAILQTDIAQLSLWHRCPARPFCCCRPLCCC